MGDRLELEVREDLVQHLLRQVEQVDGGGPGEVGRGLMMSSGRGRGRGGVLLGVRVVRLRGLARHALQPGEHHVWSACPARPQRRPLGEWTLRTRHSLHSPLCHGERSATADCSLSRQLFKFSLFFILYGSFRFGIRCGVVSNCRLEMASGSDLRRGQEAVLTERTFQWRTVGNRRCCSTRDGDAILDVGRKSNPYEKNYLFRRK